jgi:hypothetical protein
MLLFVGATTMMTFASCEKDAMQGSTPNQSKNEPNVIMSGTSVTYFYTPVPVNGLYCPSSNLDDCVGDVIITPSKLTQFTNAVSSGSIKNFLSSNPGVKNAISGMGSAGAGAVTGLMNGNYKIVLQSQKNNVARFLIGSGNVSLNNFVTQLVVQGK